MRKSRFTDSQIMDALRRVEAGIGVPDLCRDMGICAKAQKPARSTVMNFWVSFMVNSPKRLRYVSRLKTPAASETGAEKLLSGDFWCNYPFVYSLGFFQRPLFGVFTSQNMINSTKS